MADTTCFYTILENKSGTTKTFSFLRRHGVTLDAGEQVAVRGNIFSTLAGHKRKFEALERAVSSGNLSVVATPAVHIYDANTGATRTLSIDATGAVAVVDPCWAPAA